MTDKYPRFRMKVNSQSYGFSAPQGRQNVTKLSGGFSRFQPGLIAGATDFSISVTCTNTDEQQYVSAFIEGLMREDSSGNIHHGIEAGKSPFILEMVSRGCLEDHLVRMKYDSLKWRGYEGFKAEVSFVVETEPLLDQELNSNILDMVENGIDPKNLTETLDRMGKFVKVDMRRMDKK